MKKHIEEKISKYYNLDKNVKMHKFSEYEIKAGVSDLLSIFHYI